jgi:hypothetical protein
MSHSTVSLSAWEHRASERISLRAWCFVEARERTHLVLTSDFSLGGIGLDGSSALRVGDKPIVHVMLPDGGELRASAEVVYVSGKRAGLRWVSVSPELAAVYQSLTDDEVTGVRRIFR